MYHCNLYLSVLYRGYLSVSLCTYGIYARAHASKAAGKEITPSNLLPCRCHTGWRGVILINSANKSRQILPILSSLVTPQVCYQHPEMP